MVMCYRSVHVRAVFGMIRDAGKQGMCMISEFFAAAAMSEGLQVLKCVRQASSPAALGNDDPYRQDACSLHGSGECNDKWS